MVRGSWIAMTAVLYRAEGVIELPTHKKLLTDNERLEVLEAINDHRRNTQASDMLAIVS